MHDSGYIATGIALIAVLIALGIELAVQWLRYRQPARRLNRGRSWS